MNKITRAHEADSDRGAGMVEYGILVGLVAIVSAFAVASVETSADGQYESVAMGLSHVPPAAPSDSTTTTAPATTTTLPATTTTAAPATTTTTLPPTTTTTLPPTTTTTVPPTTTTTVPATTTTTAPAVPPGSTSTNTASTSSFTWWEENRNGSGEGEWKASATFSNTWIRHQYLTFEVSVTDHTGKVTKTTITDFYVPAGGKSTLEDWGHDLSITKAGVVKGDVKVTIKVTAIRTSDVNWKTVNYTTNGPTVVVNAPATP